MEKISRIRSRVVSLALVLVAVLGFWWASVLSGTGQVLVASLASAILSIGALSLVYEVWMRESIHAELLELVGVEKTVAGTRLSAISSYDEFNWSATFGGSKSIRAILSNPDPWLISHFPTIADLASLKATKVQILLPSENGQAGAIAAFHGVSQSDFTTRVSRAAAMVEETWKGRADIAKGSSLEIRTHDRFCASAMIETDARLLVIYYPPAGSAGQGINNGLVLAFDRIVSSYPASGLSKHLDHVVENSVPLYVNERSS